MTQSDFIRELAELAHFTLGDLMNRANVLRDAEMLARGGRGNSALTIEVDQAATIVLAAMSGASANTCPDAVRKLNALESTRNIDLSGLPPDAMIRREVDGVEIEPIAVKDYDPTGVDMTETVSLGQLLTMILDDPTKADHVKSLTVDHINGYAIITRTDGKEVVFGDFNEDSLNSGVKIFLHGRVLRALACSLLPEDERYKDKGYFEWIKQVVEIGNEKGDEAAQIWMKENPFKPGKE